MKHIFRTLLGNAHILLIALVVAALSFGGLQGTPAASQANSSHQAQASPAAHSTLQLTTKPHTSANAAQTTESSSSPQNPASGSSDGQSVVAAPGGTGAPARNTVTAPISQSPNVSCTPCSNAAGCTNTCTTSTPVTPPADPPVGNCHPCGTVPQTTGPRMAPAMCYMYCTQDSPANDR